MNALSQDDFEIRYLKQPMNVDKNKNKTFESN